MQYWNTPIRTSLDLFHFRNLEPDSRPPPSMGRLRRRTRRVPVHVLTDGRLARVRPLLPSSDGRRDRPFQDNLRMVEGTIYRLAGYAGGVRSVADHVEASLPP
jgi:hypothetical protein